MGCCGSKEYSHENDINTPLLNDDITGDNRMNYQTYEPIDVQKEQEFWDNIIDKTTQNLIDISSSLTDPLQYSDIQEREIKYRHLLEQIKPKQPSILNTSITCNNSNHSNHRTTTNAVIETLSDAKPNGGMNDNEVDWLYQTMDELQDALHHINIQPVGEMVVHLNMADNSIKAF
ncbi:hypothetical protein BDB01DRAFT_781142 [Pilobolus umbonatus]|nr:hypothetical protein BDB01DRAFT_781142 [Pilobolus umbonatus]